VSTLKSRPTFGLSDKRLIGLTEEQNDRFSDCRTSRYSAAGRVAGRHMTIAYVPRLPTDREVSRKLDRSH